LETKTTKEIIFENSTYTFTKNNGKNILFYSDKVKWVSVDDIIERIDILRGFAKEWYNDFTVRMLDGLKDELSQSNPEVLPTRENRELWFSQSDIEQLRKELHNLLPEDKVLVNISWLDIQIDNIFDKITNNGDSK